MKTTLLLLSLFFPTLLQAQSTACTAVLATVNAHIGEHVWFCGTPTQVSAPSNVKGDPVYLNFGGKYPNDIFAVLIWGEVSGKQRAKLVKRYTGKQLQIRGYVQERNGKPEIIVKELGDIKVGK